MKVKKWVLKFDFLYLKSFSLILIFESTPYLKKVASKSSKINQYLRNKWGMLKMHVNHKNTIGLKNPALILKNATFDHDEKRLNS